MKVFVKVKPHAKKDVVKELDASRFEISVRALPKEGKANAAVIAALAKHIGVAPSRISILKGSSSKHKVLDVN